jgi:hypothetical protein
MEVITQYPIIITNSAAQSESEYRRTYSAAEGGDVSSIGTMDVITDYPIVHTDSNAQSKAEYRRTYSAAFGDGWLTTAAGRERRRKRREERQKSGNTFGQKVGKFAQSDLGKGLLGKVLGGGGDGTGTPSDLSAMPLDEPKEGMSKGMKIGLIVGGLAILGVGAYFLLSKKGATKASA